MKLLYDLRNIEHDENGVSKNYYLFISHRNI